MTKLNRVASDAAQYGNTLREIEERAWSWLINDFTTVCDCQRGEPLDTLQLARECVEDGWMSVNGRDEDDEPEQLCGVEQLAAEFDEIIAGECHCKKCDDESEAREINAERDARGVS